MPLRYSPSNRPELQEYFLRMLDLVSSRSTCGRRSVGSIITTDKGHILSTGYNGVPSTVAHCIEVPCSGINDPSGDSSRCFAVHAEQNALLQCWRLDLARTMYCTVFPCFICAKMIANTQINKLIYREEYADRAGLVLLTDLGFELVHVPRST
jgi:dCMP deaminase